MPKACPDCQISNELHQVVSTYNWNCQATFDNNILPTPKCNGQWCRLIANEYLASCNRSRRFCRLVWPRPVNGYAKFAQPLHVRPASEAETEKVTQHPPVAVLAKMADSFALRPDVVPQPPAIGHRLKQCPPHKRKAPRQNCPNSGFRRNERDLT